MLHTVHFRRVVIAIMAFLINPCYKHFFYGSGRILQYIRGKAKFEEDEATCLHSAGRGYALVNRVGRLTDI